VFFALADDIFELADCRSAADVERHSTEAPVDLRYFQKTFAKLMEDYQGKQGGDRQRPKG